MAAEVMGRVCYGLELDPKYVDVVIGRWQAATGLAAKLDGASVTFDEARIGRADNPDVESRVLAEHNQAE